MMSIQKGTNMTTIAWDGNIIASDSRVVRNPKEINTYNCAHCGNPADIVRSSTKLIISPKGTWKGKKIICAGFAGSLLLSKQIIRFLSNPVEKVDLSTALKIVFNFRENPHGLSFTNALFLTEERELFNISYENNSETIEELDVNEPTAIGSGKMSAKFAMKVLKENAINAVFASTLVDSSSYGPVKYFDTTQYEDGNNSKQYKSLVTNLSKDEIMKIFHNTSKENLT